MYAGYQGFGATPTIKLDFGPAWSQCMREEIAKSKAHPGTANTARCTALMQSAGGGGVPTLAWVALGVAVVGGGAALWWFKFRKP